MILASHGIIDSQIASFDADAAAFFARVTAANGTLSTTEKQAVNQLVLDLKANSLWTPMKAIYPMVGASAAACAQNLKSASFTGTFTATGWTFASTGAKPNGTAYMDTNLIPSSELALDSSHLSYYSRTNITSTQSNDMGSGVATKEIYILYAYQGASYIANNNSGFSALPNITNTLGLFINTRTISTTIKRFLRNTSNSYALNSVGLSTKNIYVGAHNGPSAIEYSTKECAFASIGYGLDDTQASNLYTAVQAFQTTLSRNV